MASFMGMGQGMQMGGGEQKELKKYKLTLDNFFFWKIMVRKEVLKK